MDCLLSPEEVFVHLGVDAYDWLKLCPIETPLSSAHALPLTALILCEEGHAV